ncbi:DUF4865 family protein [Nakamurella lactea]|uniref:DUF4865 family protein n=1 Tax=Nakamurella lactea TaxID=459515 RepID=UPI00041CEEE1|nr:DUF4865 family protein [Nakamurella lactea]
MNSANGANHWMMQYPITLPADYDMQIIRHRVATKGSALDGRNGLGFKAYAIRERGIAGSEVNQYAPFYLWSSTASAADFLAGPDALFRGIVTSFGRPRVRNWLPVAVSSGPTAAADVRAARLWTRAIPPGEDLSTAAARLTTDTSTLAAQPAVHRVAAGIDPNEWHAALFVTATESLPESASPTDRDGAILEGFEVLHVSEGPTT